MTPEEMYLTGLLMIGFFIFLSIIATFRERKKEKKLSDYHRELQDKIEKEKEDD